MMRQAAGPLNFEAEFDRVVGAFLPNRVHDNDGANSVDGDRSGTEFIYRRALEIIDTHGISALTFRKLAADLTMSTRTLRKRVGSRDNLIRAAIGQYAGSITVAIRRTGPWEEAAQLWCADLYRQLMARRRITELMTDSDSLRLDRQIGRIAEYAVRQGVPRELAVQCCRSLARVTINDAVLRSRSGESDAASAGRFEAEAAYSDAVRWVIAGVRTEGVFA